MPRDWKDISTDEMLNYADAQTAEMSRYSRIMQQRSIDAMSGLSDRLKGVMGTIHQAADLAQDTANKAMQKYDAAATTQGRQQTAMVALTIALAVCTLVYTLTNVYVAFQISKANDVQAQMVAVAKEQAAAAREANEIQRRTMEHKQ